MHHHVKDKVPAGMQIFGDARKRPQEIAISNEVIQGVEVAS